MQKLSITAALTQARACHGPLIKWGRDQWRYSVKTPRGYYETSGRPYRIASQSRARSIAADALAILGYADVEPEIECMGYTGTPRQIVADYIAKQRAAK